MLAFFIVTHIFLNNKIESGHQISSGRLIHNFRAAKKLYSLFPTVDLGLPNGTLRSELCDNLRLHDDGLAVINCLRYMYSGASAWAAL